MRDVPRRSDSERNRLQLVRGVPSQGHGAPSPWHGRRRALASGLCEGLLPVPWTQSGHNVLAVPLIPRGSSLRWVQICVHGWLHACA
eukprot:7385168-Prymnesium_polylepis.1